MVQPPSTALPRPGRYAARRRPSRAAWALAVVLHLLIFALMLLRKEAPVVSMAQQGLKTFFLPAGKPGEEEAQAVEQRSETRETRTRAEPEVSAEPPPAPAPPPLPPNDLQMPFIQMSRNDFAASNIGRMASQRPALADAGRQGDSKAVQGPGAGPGGATLYEADWYRPPTDAELRGYLPAHAPRSGWGLIACRTAERYRVEDCYTIGESPLGSGFGKAVREAAWQFLVLPPRINGRPMVGSWVRIRIDYSTTLATP